MSERITTYTYHKDEVEKLLVDRLDAKETLITVFGDIKFDKIDWQYLKAIATKCRKLKEEREKSDSVPLTKEDLERKLEYQKAHIAVLESKIQMLENAVSELIDKLSTKKGVIED